MKFSEDVIPLTDLKINPGKIIKQIQRTHRPVLVTNRGRGVAVMQELSDYETQQDEKHFIRAVTQGLIDVKEKRVHSLDEVKMKLGL